MKYLIQFQNYEWNKWWTRKTTNLETKIDHKNVRRNYKTIWFD